MTVIAEPYVGSVQISVVSLPHLLADRLLDLRLQCGFLWVD